MLSKLERDPNYANSYFVVNDIIFYILGLTADTPMY